MIFLRNNQVSALEKLYRSKENEAVVFYSTDDTDIHDIVKEFLSDKDFFYYKAIPVSIEEQLSLFFDSMSGQLTIPSDTEMSYAAILKEMLNKKCEKRVIVIDEFQHIIKYSNELITEILKSIANKWENQPVLFLLLSTNAWFVEHQMVEKLADNAYNLSGLIKLKELSFVDVMQYFKDYSKPDSIIAYGILGGKSKRLACFDPKKSLKDNIINNILDTDSFLYNRGLNMLPKELRESSVYNTILLNIATGHSQLNKLHKITGFSRAKISVYLNNLIEHDLIEKVNSFGTLGKADALKGVYSIKDGFLSFFYRFVYKNISHLSIITKEQFYKQFIANELMDFGREAFCRVCFEYLMILNRLSKLPIKIEKSGKWLGKVGNIDIVCTDSEKHTLIGMCEFKKDMMSFEDFEWLKFCVSKAKLDDDVYYLFSKKDFDERIKMYAMENDNVVLIDLSML